MELAIRFARAMLSPAALMLAVIAALIALSTAPVWAADGGVYEEIRPYIVELIGLAAAAAVAYAVQLLRRWTGIEVEARHREALQSALTNAAVLAAEKGMAAGSAYVAQSVPDALRHFKLDSTGVKRLLEPKVAARK